MPDRNTTQVKLDQLDDPGVCVVWITLALQFFACQTETINEPEPTLLATTDNFTVTSYPSGPAAKELARQCERWRNEFQRRWIGERSTEKWNPKCEIFVHASRPRYIAAVGRGGGQTSGSSLIEFERGRVVTRRIDLLVDSRGAVTALPHELTHVVLTDRFGGREPPRWADEGIATLADSERKRELHRRDCWRSLQQNRALRVVELFSLNRLHSADQQAAFYGQSLTMVSFLVRKKTPVEFVRFVELAMEEGYDFALAECYEIQGLAHLERIWREDSFSRLAAETR